MGFPAPSSQDYANNNIIPNPNPNGSGSAISKKMFKLNGNDANKTGLGITLRVMSGDKLDIYGKSYYFANIIDNTNTPSIPVLDIIGGLIAAPTGATAGKGATTSILNSNTTGTVTPVSSFLTDPNRAPGLNKPQAYINYIIFDEQFNVVKNGFSAVNQFNGNVKDHAADLQNISVTKNGYVYIYVSNQSPVDVYFDNLQVVQTKSALIEETHYYPFGLTMSGISSKALNFGDPENKKGFNGIEHTTDIDLNQYDAFYRTLDPQIGRFLQVDPKIESAEAWSPYSAMLDNPIRYSDPLGDSTIPGAGFWRNAWEGFKDGGKETVSFVKSLGTAQGWQNLGNSIADAGDRLNPTSPTGLAKNAIAGQQVVEAVKDIPNMTKDDVGHAIGYGTEKVAEAVALTKGVGAVSNAIKGAEVAGISNPIPRELARVVPNSAGDLTTLAKPGATDAFVTASSDIKGMNATQIANRLTIPESSTGFKVITFKTPYGIATPINRDIPGFIGGGRTAGGAREFVVPNQVIPEGAKIKVVN